MDKQVFNSHEFPWHNLVVGLSKELVGSDILGESSSLKIYSLQADEVFESHEHDYLHVMYFLKGYGKIRIDDMHEEIYPGLVAIVRPHQCHSLTNTSSENMEIIVFETKECDKKRTPYIDF